MSKHEEHEEVRGKIRWGTYGKEGDKERSYILLKDMSTDHILACLGKNEHGYNHLGSDIILMTHFINEIEWRIYQKDVQPQT